MNVSIQERKEIEKKDIDSEILENYIEFPRQNIMQMDGVKVIIHQNVLMVNYMRLPVKENRKFVDWNKQSYPKITKKILFKKIIN